MNANHLLPSVNVKYTPDPKAKKKKIQGRPPAKYDHAKMIEKRVKGASWKEIAAELGIASGHAAKRIALRSSYAKTIPPCWSIKVF